MTSSLFPSPRMFAYAGDEDADDGLVAGDSDDESEEGEADEDKKDVEPSDGFGDEEATQ